MSSTPALPGSVKDQVIGGFTQAAGRFDEGGTEFFTDMGAVWWIRRGGGRGRGCWTWGAGKAR